jgi:hypothetical protein
MQELFYQQDKYQKYKLFISDVIFFESIYSNLIFDNLICIYFLHDRLRESENQI